MKHWWNDEAEFVESRVDVSYFRHLPTRVYHEHGVYFLPQ